MPDRRTHRGAHPDDAKLFGPAQWPTLQQAAAELGWLLDRGYARRSSLALVGDRHQLTQRQRTALSRCTATADQCRDRAAREVPRTALAGATLYIDGYNLLITIESALGGAVLVAGRDRCVRDLAGLHGTYRQVDETLSALAAIGKWLIRAQVESCHWILDQPVANSGRLRGVLRSLASTEGWNWNVELAAAPDAVLVRADGIIVTSDSVVLDRCIRWNNLASDLVATTCPGAWMVPISPGASSGPSICT